MINKNELVISKRKYFQGFLNESKRTDIFISILGFFIARASIMKGMTPFSISFLSGYLSKGNSLFIPLLLSAGVLSVHKFKRFEYLFSIWTIYFIYNIFLSKKKNISSVYMSLISSLIYVGFKLINIIVLKNYYIYDLLMVLFEGIIIFTLGYIFSNGIQVIKSKNKIKTNDDIICIFIVFAITLSGFNEISIFNLSIKNILSVFLILLFAYNKGATFGAGMGATLGMISYLYKPDMPFILSALSLSGLISGVFKDLGRIGSILGFVLGNSIISFYINGYLTSFIDIREIIISSVLFYFLYGYIENNFVGNLFGLRDVEKSYSDRIKDITSYKLKEISDVFSELSSTFEKVYENKKLIGNSDIAGFVDGVVNKVCKNCSMRKFCWQDDFYTTYYSMFSIVNMIELNGFIEEKKLPDQFKKNCMRTEDIVYNLNYMFDMYKVSYIWREKIFETKELISEQFSDLSDIIEELIEDINKNIEFDKDLEKVIYTDLRNEGIDVSEVLVIENGENFEINLELDRYSNKKSCLDDAISIVSKSVGMPLKEEFQSYNSYESKDRIKYTLIEANKYAAFTETSTNKQPLNYISGDSFTFGENKNMYFAALGDGMGVGSDANLESTIAITLLEKFLEAGFDKELALRTINSVLVLKSTDEMFTTLDIATIDLCTGKLQAVKTGAAPTFIKKEDGIEVINSTSLPVGMLKDVDFQVYETYLDDGDIIVMMSDGVLDANIDAIDKEKWMADVIQNIDSVNPKNIANLIMKEANMACNNKIKDDMTILVTKFWKTR